MTDVTRIPETKALLEQGKICEIYCFIFVQDQEQYFCYGLGVLWPSQYFYDHVKPVS